MFVQHPIHLTSVQIEFPVNKRFFLKIIGIIEPGDKIFNFSKNNWLDITEDNEYNFLGENMSDWSVYGRIVIREF